MTPAGHFLKAVALMERVDEVSDPCSSYARSLTAQAAVHAALAQCNPGATVLNVRNVGSGSNVDAIRNAQTTGDRL